MSNPYNVSQMSTGRAQWRSEGTGSVPFCSREMRVGQGHLVHSLSHCRARGGVLQSILPSKIRRINASGKDGWASESCGSISLRADDVSTDQALDGGSGWGLSAGTLDGGSRRATETPRHHSRGSLENWPCIRRRLLDERQDAQTDTGVLCEPAKRIPRRSTQS
jgi:hypothetical protein